MAKERMADKNRDVRDKSGLKRVVGEAQQDYENWCDENGEEYNQSTTHSYSDVLQQATVLAIPGKTSEDAKRLAKLTLYGHLVDDKVDPIENFGEKYADCKNFEDFIRKSPADVKRVADKMISLAETDKQRNAIKNILIYNIVQGARVQESKTVEEQKKYTNAFKDSRVGLIRDGSLKEDINRLHPMLFYQTTHGDVDGFFENEGVDQDADVGQVFSTFYAPMLYVHDAKEEAEGAEEFKVLYGKEMTEDGVIGDEYLTELIDVFDKNVTRVSDKNLGAHLKQMQMVYHSFEPVLSPALRKRYGESMSKFEKYVDQQVGEVGAPKGVSRKGLEGILGVLAVVSFISFLLVNPSISGNVVLSNSSRTASVLGPIFLVVGVSFLGIIIWSRFKARKFRKSFFR